MDINVFILPPDWEGVNAQQRFHRAPGFLITWR